MSNIFACYSENIRNVYNNLLIFVVNDENNKPPQLYIFQCALDSVILFVKKKKTVLSFYVLYFNL